MAVWTNERLPRLNVSCSAGLFFPGTAIPLGHCSGPLPAKFSAMSLEPNSEAKSPFCAYTNGCRERRAAPPGANALGDNGSWPGDWVL